MFENQEPPSAIRRGRFLWLPEQAKKSYIKVLKDKIAKGHFTSDSILSQIVDELAPFYVDSAAHE